jgi:protein SCO1/2
MTDSLALKQRRAIRLTVAGLAAIIALVVIAIFSKFINMKPDLKAQLDEQHTLLFSTPRAVPDVALTRHDGAQFNRDQFIGKWDVVNFGYTYCPDICPTNMADMKVALNQLETLGLDEDVRFWMVSVDPTRDTVEQLQLYVPYFHPDFIGLTGELGQITTLATQLSAVFYQEGEGEGYTVAHSDNYAIIDPNGHFIALMRPPHRPSHISSTLQALIDAQ